MEPKSLSNFLGIAGLLGVVVCVGALAGIWWGGLAGSLELLAAAVLVARADAPAASQPAADSRPFVVDGEAAA